MAGWMNSLSMKLLALTAPGVPDLYQGSELWDLSLVDPDNRRPVDFELRGRLLDELDALGAAAGRVAWQRRDEGLPKLLLVHRALGLRAERPELFAGASYEPLPASGAAAGHVVAFCRGGGAVVVVPRLSHGLRGNWGDTAVELPAGRWVDRVGGRTHEGGAAPLAGLLADFPVALLEARGDFVPPSGTPLLSGTLGGPAVHPSGSGGDLGAHREDGLTRSGGAHSYLPRTLGPSVSPPLREQKDDGGRRRAPSADGQCYGATGS